MKCVCNHEMTRHDWKCQWVCHRCGRTKPIEESITNADRMIEILQNNEAESLLNWWEEIFEDGVPALDYFKWWLQQPAEE